MVLNSRILIIGAGPAGLGAAWRCQELGADWTLLEAAEEPGGLSASFVDPAGFTWDFGGHVLFSHYEYFDRVMDELLGPEGWLTHVRSAWVYMNGRMIAYPLQNNIHQLAPADAAACIDGLEAAAREAASRQAGRPDGTAPAVAAADEAHASLRDWFYGRFGRALAELFLIPYNTKQWAHDPAMLSATWVGQRVAPVDAAKLRRQLAQQGTVEKGTGGKGTGSVSASFAETVPVSVASRSPVPGLRSPATAGTGTANGAEPVPFAAVPIAAAPSGWGPNARFRFPLRGGTGAVWSECFGRLDPSRAHLGREVVGIDADRKQAICRDGSTWPYDTLISTIPLDTLASITSHSQADTRHSQADTCHPQASLPSAWGCELSRDIRTVNPADSPQRPSNIGKRTALGGGRGDVRGLSDLAGRLKYSSTNVVGLGFDGPLPEALAGRNWIYFPYDDVPCYRATVFSNYSPHNTPPGRQCWSLMCEVSQSPYKPVDVASLPGQLLMGLRNCGLLAGLGEPASIWQAHRRHGYPIPTLDRDAILAEIHAQLEAMSILSRGRFGGWKYEVGNMDHCFMQGLEAVDRIIRGKDERTYPFPDKVNT